jgi:hypothetical protein
MILAATLIAAVLAIVVSEVLGRGKVVYTRVATLAAAYAVACVLADLVVRRFGGSMSDELVIPLSVVPIMAAWLGFRIHLSNSITLEMLTLLEHQGPQSTQELVRAYDPQEHAAIRLRILRDAGYLVGEDDHVAPTAKGRVVLTLMRVLCGTDGPRAVVSNLARRRAGQA